MDEYARRQGHRDNTLIVDWAKGKPLATCKGRRAADGIAWFQSRPQAERDQGEVGGMDMSKTDAWAIQHLFGEKVHVIDRFHVVPLAVGAREGVLRSVRQQLAVEEATALKKLRKRWLQSANQLDVDELLARYEWRRRFPELREVIDGVQSLRAWFERTYEKPARAALLKLIARASQSALGPLQRMAGTLSRWFEPISRYLRHRYSNGMTEGFNNNSKLIQRRA
jgi:transposase